VTREHQIILDSDCVSPDFGAAVEAQAAALPPPKASRLVTLESSGGARASLPSALAVDDVAAADGTISPFATGDASGCASS
jgi:hypothetical protein